MKDNHFVLRGSFVHTPTKDELVYKEDAYLVCEEGRCAGLFDALPERYALLPIQDYSDCIIIPGLCDVHMHASQYANKGIGKFITVGWDWFTKLTWPEESRYGNPDYAERAYQKLVEDLVRSATTRSVMFATIHREATELLMKMLDKAGQGAFVGKVITDHSSISELLESTGQALSETRQWLENTMGRYRNVKPILTPRFIPSCTKEILADLGQLVREFGLPLQSHLSEDYHELRDWVQVRFPDAKTSGEVWDQFGLFGSQTPTVMAHCIFPPKGEMELMAKRNLMVAHCPSAGLTGHVAPIKRYLNAGIQVGLGTDMSGGTPTLNLLPEIPHMIQLSKHWWVANCQRYGGFETEKPLVLSAPEAFYIATKGGGAFFGKVGSFEAGYAFDAVVIDDASLRDINQRPVNQRLERILHSADERCVVAKYINARKVL